MPSDHKHPTREGAAIKQVLRVAGMRGASVLRPATPSWPLCMILSSVKETYETWDAYLLTGIG